MTNGGEDSAVSAGVTQLEEETIVNYIFNLDTRGFPPKLINVEDMANILCDAHDALRVGKLWASNFVKRQPELKTRWNRPYDYQRALCEDPKLIQGWFGLVTSVKAKYGIQDADTYNFDKTGFMMGQITTSMVVTSTERRGRPKIV